MGDFLQCVIPQHSVIPQRVIPQRSFRLFLNSFFKLFFYHCEGPLKYAEEYQFHESRIIFLCAILKNCYFALRNDIQFRIFQTPSKRTNQNSMRKKIWHFFFHELMFSFINYIIHYNLLSLSCISLKTGIFPDFILFKICKFMQMSLYV